MRRLGLVAAVATCVALGSMGLAIADEFDDLLDDAAEADYAGRQIVVTFFDGEIPILVRSLPINGN